MLALSFKDISYNIEPKFEVVCEIEEELGSAPELLARITSDEWSVSELVTFVHIILQYAGRSIDYMELGNSMIKEGLASYVNFANKFLNSVIYR